MHDNFSAEALSDQKLDPRTTHISDPSSSESSSSETQESSQKFMPPNPALNSNSSNDIPRSPKPPSSLLVKFAKRVAICTAVVALARFSYPYLLVIFICIRLLNSNNIHNLFDYNISLIMSFY